MKSRPDEQAPPAGTLARTLARTLVLAAGGPQPDTGAQPDAGALPGGVTLICRDLAEAADAQARGLGRDALLVHAGPRNAAGLIRAGWRVIVDLDALGEDPNTAAAAAALCAWTGVSAVRTRHVAAVRRAIDMTDSIRGIRPVPDGYARS